MSRDLTPLFDPKGVLVAGASTHPGKFGFVALHNILSCGYRGDVYATNLEGDSVLGIPVLRDAEDLADDSIDLVFVCTPAAANVELLRTGAKKGARAAFVTSAGYGETGEAGRRLEEELAATAAELGMVLAGPNGQGVVSTPSSLCAQIVAPYPPAGRIGIASQSGNFVSSFHNLARQSGVGVSRSVSVGNAAVLAVPDYFDYLRDDPATAVTLAYVETVTDGRAFFERARATTAHQPLVVLKGGASDEGRNAAASHTGALASDEKVFAGMCRQAGITQAATVEEAYEAAATFATQPRPQGPNVVVITTAGGWGVVAADAIARTSLKLVPLPADLRDEIDGLLPPRWSRNNPVDLAGGETRDTIPLVIEKVARHPEVHAVLLLGIGIQSNEARMMRTGAHYPDHGLERIVAFHEAQDARYARVAAEVSEATGKPILVATELAVSDPDNPGPAAVRASGRVCYWSANRAVTALDHLWRYARFSTRMETTHDPRGDT
jgi:acetyltransferase